MQRWILGTITVVSFTLALGLIGYVSWSYWDLHQQEKQFHKADDPKHVEPFLAPTHTGGSARIVWTYSGKTGWSCSLDELSSKQATLTTEWKKRPKEGERIGTLQIPSIEAEVPMWAGTDSSQLSKGVGVHSLGLPGESELVGLAGHRETVFRRAGKIRKGDKIILDTDQGQFTYIVTRTWITDEDDRSVVVSTGKPLVRAYTCFPFDAPDSPQRYVIEAEMI